VARYEAVPREGMLWISAVGAHGEIGESVLRYALALVRATRPQIQRLRSGLVKTYKYVNYGPEWARREDLVLAG